MTPRAATVLLTFAVAACRSSTPGAAPAAPATAMAARAAAVPLRGGGAGDTAVFAARLLTVAYSPSRATYELGRAAYVTMLSVDDKTITALTPVVGMRSELVGGGSHTAGFSRQTDDGKFSVKDRFGNKPGVAEDAVSAAAVMEYNRCLANARRVDAARRQGPRQVVGRDSAGRPIYGPPTEVQIDELKSEERRCKMPAIGPAPANAPAMPAKQGRFLLLFASDTPIAYRDITELVVTAADIRGTATLIGEKLFATRGGNWSVSYLPW